jgi:hypothetical protein
MKGLLVRVPAMAVISLLSGALTVFAQNAPVTTPESNPPQAPSSGGKVIFSRSTDDQGKTTTTVGPTVDQAAPAIASEPLASDAERLAVTVTALDLDVHLHTAAHRIAVRAVVIVRNDRKTPLARIPLQISSSLSWEQIRIAGSNVHFSVATLNSDTDHTGQLHEVDVPLSTPLAPGATLQIDALYSGPIVPSAQRLTILGTPDDVALHSDWDEISPAFTGLRGFGNVVWYPVASIPVILGDGSRLFDEVGRHKLALSQAHFHLRLTVEFPNSEPPTVAIINGVPSALTVSDPAASDPDLSGIATATADFPALGFLAPSLFIAERKAHAGPNLTAFTTPDNDISVQSWIDEAAGVTPFLQGWLGKQPRAQLTLLDLPDPDDAPYETGALLVTGLHTGPADQMDRALVHIFAHAYTEGGAHPTPAWLNEGLATFMESLWVEKNHGRERALEMLEADRSALALAEPSSPGESAGSPLAVAIAPVYYRTKAAYIFWMLRDLTSDDALSSAFKLFCSPPPIEAGTAKSLTGNPLYDDLKQAGVRRDLSWLFADWVTADKGLPDLAIENVFPNAAQAGTWLVAVNVTNAGYAGADVPVTVRTAKNSVTERVFVPARGRAVERIVVVGPPTQVQLNDGTVPETQASVHVTDLTPSAPQAASRSAEQGSSSSNFPSQPQ